MRGTLRIHFTDADLARLRLAEGPDPLWEIVLASQKLGATTGGLAFDHWRAVVGEGPAPERRRSSAGMVRALVPRHGSFPDFITPVEGMQGLEAGVATLARTPAARMRTEFEVIARTQRLPSSARGLTAGSADAMRELVGAVRAFHDTCVAPYWPVVQAHVDADRALRARAFLDGGCEGVLNSLRPVVRWSKPVLEADYPVDTDVHLRGRGLVLVPSFFCWSNPVTLMDRSCPVPVLVHPVEHDLTLTAAHGDLPGAAGTRLEALVGRTRGRLLAGLTDMRSTGELARRFALSSPAVSQHIGVLRDAGLVVTRRDGNRSLHHRTALGTALCDTTL
ncbi:transcriptional regulator [Amycolatopsis sp. NBRC 101858]|uniref:ArsR/SmtB family transcription factor n=1 Tax=Amycolatopsis sp. NBRC 101858 TaxID=3032200 RepID=UPI0024A299AF|nr:winged helix-turn-helix domain-containing protein [Amycolatopsis sp. NBRC 101858]GLY38031.1 transcriptional regulator [Amycolatopsis sp. NBRC 101858]